MADGLLNKASIILTPTGYKAGTLYNVAPVVEPYEDFDFARASVASRVNSSGLVEMVGRTLGSELVQNGDFSELGSELVTNGDFATDSDWTKTQSGNDTIVIENGYALFNCPDNSNIFISQSSVMTIGKTYTASFDIISIDSGGFLFGNGGGGTISGSPTANTVGTHTFTFVATTASFVIKRALGSPNLLNGKIDNVSVKQVDPNDRWTLGADWSIEDGVAVLTGSGSLSPLTINYTFTSANTYKLTYEITSYTNGGLQIVANNQVIPSSVGTHTVYVTGVTAIAFKRDGGINGGVANLSIDNVSVKEVIDTNNIPRISYDSNGDNGHILLEPTSTNLIINNNNSFTENKTSITYNNINSPEGIQNAFKVEATATGTAIYVRTSDITFTDATFSVFVKYGNNQWLQFLSNQSANHYFNFDLQNGVFGTNGTSTSNLKATDFGNGWYRVSGTFTGNTGLCQLRVYLSNASGTGYGGASATSGDFFYSYGWQAEQLSYATSYIPTLTGSTETRATETATGAGSAELINSTEGVLYAEIAALRQVNDNVQFLAINSSSYTQNSIYIQLRSATNQIGVWAYSNGSNEVAEPITLTDVTSFNKIAIRWKVNEFNVFINGTSVFTDTSYNAPTSNSLNTLEFARGGTSNIYCKCKALAVFNEALSDDELNNLTG